MSGRSLASYALRVVVGISALTLFACDSQARQEAASIAMAVERFRQADNPRKPELADALKALPCSAADVCAARDACLASTEPTARALRLKVEVEGAIAGLAHGGPPPPAEESARLTAKLDEASALLKQGFEALGPCDERIMTLKRTYRF